MRKWLVNPVLRRFGYQLVKLPRFQVLLEDVFARTGDFFFVQIGANDGTSFDDLHRFVTSHPCSGLVVEPLPEYFERLTEAYGGYPSIRPVRKAVHPTAKVLPIYRVAPERLRDFPAWARGIASFDPDHHLKANIPKNAIVAEEVPCVSLRALLDENGVSKLDLLQVDVEGFDAEIVKMIDFSRFPPTLLKYEHKALSPMDRTDCEALLDRHGYRLFRDAEDTVAVRRG